jgi:hypothetical protein
MQNDAPRDMTLTGSRTLNGVGAWEGPEPPEVNAQVVASALRDGARLESRVIEQLIEESMMPTTEDEGK